MSTYDEAYHPAGCSCGQPAGPMSVQEFLRTCLYPRILEQKDNFEQSTIGGVSSLIPLPKRQDFLPKEYDGTDIWDGKNRHPLLCLHGHYNWEHGAEKTPSSFTINTGGNTLSTIKTKIEKGDYISGAHFKHHINELDDCHCGNGRTEDEKLREIQRNAALANQIKGIPILLQYDDTYELRFFTKVETNGCSAGIHNIDEIESKSVFQPSDLQESVSIWLQSRNVGVLPGNCASFLCFENTDKSLELFLPDEGKIILIIPEIKKDKYLSLLRNLRDLIPDGVYMRPGSASSLKALENYRQGIIEWSDTNSQDYVKKFLQEITGLNLRNLRSTRPLMVDVYDSNENYEVVTPVSIDRKSEYAMDIGETFFIKIRRTRNAPLEGFRLLLGPGISPQTLKFNGLEASPLGEDDFSGGHLWKIFVRSKTLQNGLWASLKVESHEHGAWLEVFDHSSNVEQSGSRILIVSKESI